MLSRSRSFGLTNLHLCRRQQFVTGGVQHMVETLNAGGKFAPFLATMVMGWLDERNELRLEW